MIEKQDFLQRLSHEDIRDVVRRSRGPFLEWNHLGWVVPGLAYLTLVMFIHAPWFLPKFNQAYFSNLLIAFLLGVSYVLRDVIQLNYESKQTGTMSARYGLFLSMVFVALGSVIVLNTGVDYIRTPGAAAFFLGALADGLMFTLLAGHSLGVRIFYSNVAGAVVDQVVYRIIRSLDVAHPLTVVSGVSQHLFYILVMVVPVFIFLAFRWGGQALGAWHIDRLVSEAFARKDQDSRLIRLLRDMIGKQ